VKFWDASALIPLCLREPRTPLLRSLTRADGAIAAWWGSPIECYSAFARLRRDRILSRAGEHQARRIIDRLAAEWTEIEPGREIRDQAGRIFLLHPLRAVDSLQLAAAMVWAHMRPAGQHFVSLDQRLREAASREGFYVLPETDDTH